MKNTSHSAKTSLAVALVLGIGIALGGCAAEPVTGGSGPDSAQTDPGAKPDTNDKGSVDKNADVPGWVIDGFPLYPGSENYAVTESYGTQILGFTVPKSDEATIYQWFVEQYSQNGWESYDHNDETSDFGATHADGREVYINVTQASYVMTAKQG